MPSKKKDGSKKTEQKKKQKLVEDKTFGLKNKNKSKKVQAHIQSVSKNVFNSGDPKQRKLDEANKKAKADRKARKKAADDEKNALFNEALIAVSKKKSTDKKAGQVGAKGRDADEENTKKGTSRAMKMMYQMDAKEMEEKLKEDVSISISNVEKRVSELPVVGHVVLKRLCLLCFLDKHTSRITCQQLKMRLKHNVRK